jgi:hypothetical protein
MARQWFATAHLRRWQAEAEAEANTEAAAATKSNPDAKPDPDAELLASLPKYEVPTAEEVSFKALMYTAPKEYEAVARQSQIEGCTPRELWNRTKHTHHLDPATDTWLPAPPRNIPRAQPITPP